MLFTILAEQAIQTPTWLNLLMIIVPSFLASGIATNLFHMKKNKSETRKSEEETELVRIDGAKKIQEASLELLSKMREEANLIEKRSKETARIAHEEIMCLQAQNREILTEMMELKEQVKKLPELEEMILELQRGIAVLTEQLAEHDISPLYVFNMDDKMPVVTPIPPVP